MGTPGFANQSTARGDSSKSSEALPTQLSTDPIALATILCFTLFLAWRMFSWTNLYAVDLMYMDQWDFYTPLFEHAGPAQLFTWQHGPHRQGIGMLVIAVLAKLTHWNAKADAFAVAGALCAATILALLLKRRLFGALTWSDLLIPALLLTMRQWESLIAVPNLSHSAMPLMLLMLYALAWTIRRTSTRYGAVLILNFVTLYTGFGFFLGIVTPLLLMMEFVRLAKLKGYRNAIPAALALGLSLLSFASFFAGYVFEPAAPDFRFPDPRFYLYPHMMALLFANGAGFVGTGFIPSLIGWALLPCVIWVGFVHGRSLVVAAAKDETSNTALHGVIWILVTFSILFAAGVAVGRISFGVQLATFSRYVTLTLPALLGLYLHLLNRPPARWRKGVFIGATTLLAIFALHVRPREERLMATYSIAKTQWRDVYRRTEDIDIASSAIGTPIHPQPQKVHLQQKLDYLKQNHLSLFAD